MIQNNKRKISKRNLSIIITAATLVLLIVAYIIINAVLSSVKPSEDGGKTELPEILSGEALYGNRAAAYPYMAPASILAVKVTKNDTDGDNGEKNEDIYMMSKPQDSEGKRLDYFIFSYEDPHTKQTKIYYPDILYEDATFEYSNLYAIEKSNTLGVRKIDYLCAAIGALYFDDRVILSSDPEERSNQLDRYGLSPEERDTISILYTKEDGTEATHTIYIGNKLITGVGYYFMLGGRDYVYTSAASENLSYALGGFEAFIDARIISAEVDGDKGYAPNHTGLYNQFTSKFYTVEPGSGEILTVPSSGVEIIINAKESEPIYVLPKEESENIFGKGTGYRYFSDKFAVPDSAAFKNLINNLLVGKNVGPLSENIVYTVVYNTNTASLFDQAANKGVYEYTIYGIEAVIDGENGDRTAVGTKIPDGSKIKVEYSYTLDGERVCSENSHAVIDLAASSAVPDEVKEFLKNSEVGPLAAPKSFTVKYDKNNSNIRSLECVISEISLITDKNGKPISKVTAESIVNFEYYYVLDGERLGESQKRTLFLSEITEESDDYSIKDLLIGKTKSDKSLSTTSKIYCQALMDFRTYEISEIVGYNALEETVKFCYIPVDMSDPFYAKSIFKNILPETNKYSSYAMSDEACTQVVRILGGISSSSAVNAEGLYGSETVAVGLSHDTLAQYKLYDGYRIRFELPRGLDSDGESYTWLDRITFTLYIGTEILPDGSIYVASDLYDIVVKIDPSAFDFLKFSFPEFWARRNIALVDSEDIESIYVKLDFEDVYGEYSFDFKHTPLYVDSTGENYTTVPPTEDSKANHDFIKVTVRSLSDRRTDTLFSQLLDGLNTGNDKTDSYGLANIYNVAGGNAPNEDIVYDIDTLGTINMKAILAMIYSTYYIGVLSEEEIAAAKESDAPKLMELEFDLGDRSSHRFHYDFYRIDDRRIMVSLYRVDSAGNALSEASDLYISNLAFKKLVSAFTSLLNGENLDPDKAY